MISVRCSCGRVLEFPPETAGATFPCPWCGRPVLVDPAAPAAPAPDPPTRAPSRFRPAAVLGAVVLLLLVLVWIPQPRPDPLDELLDRLDRVQIAAWGDAPLDPHPFDDATLAAAGALHRTFDPGDADAAAFYDAYVRRMAELDPEYADAAGLHPHSPEVAAVDPVSVARRCLLARDAIAALDRRPIPGLDGELLRAVAESDLDPVMEARDTWVLLRVGGCFESLFDLAMEDGCAEEDRRAAATGRLRSIARLLDGLPGLLARPPPGLLQAVLDEIPRHREFLDTYADLWTHAGEDLLDAVAGAKEALDRLEGRLRDEVLPRATGEEGAGRRLFELILRRYEFEPTDSAGLFRETREAFRRLAEAYRRTPYLEDPAVPDPLERFRDELARVGAMRDRWLDLPDDPGFDVDESPPDWTDALAWYVGDPEGGRGLVLLSSADRPFGEFEIRHTAAHETYPGHHLQRMAMRGASRLRRDYGSSTFTEGWATYAEDLFHETGGCPRGPVDDSLRAVERLDGAFSSLVDIAFHTRAVPPEEILKWMELYTGTKTTLAELAGEHRYPFSHVPYDLGAREIRRLRGECGLPLREFHARLLRFGTIPPPLIRKYWDEEGN